MKKILFQLKNTGFTLIELLVVLAIIGILAGVIYASFTEARAAARDDIRKSGLKELQLAIELYKAQNGRYPSAGCGAGSNWTGPFHNTNPCSNYVAGLVPDFIAALPRDPKDESGDKGYLYSTNAAGTSYKLMNYNVVEIKLVTSYENEFARCPADVDKTFCDALPDPDTYAVYSAGAETW